MDNKQQIILAAIIGLVSQYAKECGLNRLREMEVLDDTLGKLFPIFWGETICCDASFSDAQCRWALLLNKYFNN